MDAAYELHLSFNDHVHQFDAGKKDPSTAKSFESQRGSRASLDRPMILFEKVVEIFGLADLDGRFTIIIDGFECGEIGAAYVDARRRGHLIPGNRCHKQLVAGFDQTRNRAVGGARGMGRNGCGEACDAMMCAGARRFRHSVDEGDHGAIRR